MKKILGLLLYAGLMFGVTAGLGMMLLRKSASSSAASAEHDEGDGEKSEHGESTPHESESADHGGSSDHVAASEHESASPKEASRASDDGHSSHSDERLPVAVRATPMSVEEIVRMGLSLKSRDEVVRKREESLREIEAQQRLVLADMAAAQQEVENLLAQTSDQRAAKEELLARLNAQNETLDRERKSIATDRELLKAEQEKLNLAKQTFEAEKSAVTQSESEFALKRKELDADRKQFEAEQTKVRLDGEKLAKDRESWIAEKEKISSEMKQIAADRKQLEVDKQLFEQDKRAYLSSTGATIPSTATPPGVDDAAMKKNMKSIVSVFDGLPAESAASSFKAMAADGNIDMVVEIIATMEPRKSPAVFDALQLLDDKLATDIIRKMSTRNSTSKAAKKP